MVASLLLFLTLFLALPVWGAEEPHIVLKDLKVEYETTPMGIDVEQPRFSWRMEALDERRGYRQSAYRLAVTDGQGRLMWDSGRVKDDGSTGVVYGGERLEAETRYNWRLEVWTQAGETAVEVSWFETGLNVGERGEPWEGARWIGGGDEDLTLYAPYLPVFALDCRLQLEEGSREAGVVYGANDPRLMDADLNLYGLEGRRNEAHIRVMLDVSPLDQGGEARLKVYRKGYAPADTTDAPLADWPVSRNVLDSLGRYGTHRLLIRSNLGFTRFYMGEEETPVGEVNLNPLGQGGDFIAFPVLADAGLCVPEGQAVRSAEVTVRNFRSPGGRLASLRWENVGREKGGGPLLLTATPRGSASPMLRTEFDAAGRSVVKARLYVTARGIYEIYLNGYRMGNAYFNPGATQYNKTQMYQTFDATPYIQADGQNALGAVLAEGWWSGGATYTGENWNFFGDRQSLLAKLVIWYADGSRQTVVTQPDGWLFYGDGPVRYGSFFQGEVYDARRESAVHEWARAGYDDSAWKAACEVPLEGTVSREVHPDMPRVDDYSAFVLTGQTGPTVQAVDTLTARSVEEVRPGVFVYDMGQNLAGVPLLTFPKLERGQEVRMRYAEVTYPDLPEYEGREGMLMLENIRAAMAQDIYVARGIGRETFSPRFTFHGFRYVEVTGVDRALPLEAVRAVVLSSIHRWTAGYECSNEAVNRLWRNIRWSACANFISIPTDCPQRNERLGWAGDISVFSRTATYMADVPQFLRRYVRAMRDVQRADGRFADIAPLGGGFGGLLWGSAGLTVPWECYRQYGDKALLEEHYEAMKRYVLYVAEHAIDPATNLIVQNRAWGDLGDWLGPEDGRNDKSLLWEAYYIYDLEIMQKAAEALGRTEDAHWYGQMCEARKAFFRKTYLQPGTGKTVHSAFDAGKEGRTVDTQTSYVLPLVFGIPDSTQLSRVEANLAATVIRFNTADDGKRCPPYSLMTGFIGTAWISQALSASGREDLAYRILQQEEYPSWLYSVKQGATTIWERLDSYTHTDGFGGNNRMNSFNHYSFGAVGAWLCGHSLGIRADEDIPAFKRFLLVPETDPTGQMRFAHGYYDSMYGRIESGWEVDGRTVRYRFTVPANTTAVLCLPAASQKEVRESGKSLRKPVKGVRVLKKEGGQLWMELQSGRYEFEVGE